MMFCKTKDGFVNLSLIRKVYDNSEVRLYFEVVRSNGETGYIEFENTEQEKKFISMLIKNGIL